MPCPFGLSREEAIKCGEFFTGHKFIGKADAHAEIVDVQVLENDTEVGFWHNPSMDPNILPSCSFDGPITVFIYKFIFNPLCTVGLSFVECTCAIGM